MCIDSPYSCLYNFVVFDGGGLNGLGINTVSWALASSHSSLLSWLFRSQLNQKLFSRCLWV